MPTFKAVKAVLIVVITLSNALIASCITVNVFYKLVTLLLKLSANA